MPKRYIIAGLIVGSVLMLVGVGLMVSYHAARHVPQFYTDALAQDPVRREQASQELESQVTMLYSDARKKGQWHALFTAEQINAWLAQDLVKLYGDQLPQQFRDPRVVIDSEGVTVGMRYEGDDIPVVLSLQVDVYLTHPNEIALRFRQARGSLPFPLDNVVEEITRFARETSAPLQWTQVEGDPVALITIEAGPDKHNNVLSLEALELLDGEIYVSGQTAPASAGPQSDSGPGVAEGSLLKKNVQR